VTGTRRRPALSEVEPLDGTHDLAAFDCSKPALDDWLRRFALGNQTADAARTYVVHRGKRVVGYFSLAYGSITREETPLRIARGLARHPVPVVLLARLAVDRREKGRGLGKALLKEALRRIERAADIAGARAVLVHAIDDEARAFYEHFDFEPSPVDELTLMLLIKDLRTMVRRSSMASPPTE
jgi:GNAT superfamily N-acetyltransferase